MMVMIKRFFVGLIVRIDDKRYAPCSAAYRAQVIDYQPPQAEVWGYQHGAPSGLNPSLPD